jgi:phosphoribosylglycinamide formyltransferase-1
MTRDSATAPLRVSILFSGRGSNMLALLDHMMPRNEDYAIASLICNRPNAGGIAAAHERGLTVSLIDHTHYDTKATFEAAMHAQLARDGTELICLAGFMRILSADFVGQWDQRIINIHPSLLPLYKGLDTHRRALEDGASKHGCSVHYVVPEMDAGPVILQSEVPVSTDDTEDSLAARVLAVEHPTYCAALDRVAADIRSNRSAKNKAGQSRP